MTDSDDTPHLAVLVSFSGYGGVERMILNLIHGFVAQGVAVDLLAIRAPAAAWREELPPSVRLVDLGVRHSLLALPALIGYLRKHRPPALLAAKDRAIRLAVLARRAAGVDTRLVGRLGTHLSTALVDKHPVQRWLRCRPMRWLYPQVDCIVAVSEGVAEDAMHLAGLTTERILVVRNPVVTPRMLALAQEPVSHPWFNDDGPPIILGAGRLTRQKDFPTLLRAFAALQKQRPARLAILGEGRQRHTLLAQATHLGIADCVDLPGFVANPYAYMAKAAVFALSSLWEGSPNVLTEALALGTPVVATDCPSGPREILDGGRYGPLVAVGDAAALAQGLAEMLAHPPAADKLQAAVTDYTLQASTQGYLDALKWNEYAARESTHAVIS
ncbi:MAG: glycosyltransferase [Gammaproteobacteria bacterium]|nr:glycosyltransferase [Gammaproteobacteria bacterium]MCP5458248.1 glycosyltransferase [Gammaproteobacteria bacterium]